MTKQVAQDVALDVASVAMTLSRSDILRIAAESSTDPRTVKSFLDGKAIRPMTEERIRAAMKELGLKAPKATAK